MASQSRSQRRRQQQRAQAQRRPAAPASRRPVDTRPSPPQADLVTPADATALAEDEMERVATSIEQHETALPASPAISQRPRSVGRAAPERETVTGVSSSRQRRKARPAAEPIDYTLDYDIARHDLRRIAILATLLLVVMVALRVSGVL
ncbi:hypothetical protein [Roseiflexus sp.]|uniref:hypothetical protein n=1 Tax=Roseiflexus sp. TaxID=2562120 RepID=UPI00398AA60B